MELTPGALHSISGKACESGVFEIDEQKVAAYDALFPTKEKKVMPSQRVFEKTSNTFL